MIKAPKHLLQKHIRRDSPSDDTLSAGGECLIGLIFLQRTIKKSLYESKEHDKTDKHKMLQVQMKSTKQDLLVGDDTFQG